MGLKRRLREIAHYALGIRKGIVGRPVDHGQNEPTPPPKIRSGAKEVPPHQHDDAGRCMFCGSYGLTHEHIYSDWMTKRGLFPRSGFSVESAEYNASWSHGQRLRGGRGKKYHHQITQMTARKVCYTCNNGWMREIVDAAIPHAEAVILDHDCALSPAAQFALAKWLSLMTIMAESTHEQTAGVPPSDRRTLKAKGSIPRSWTICIGRYHGRHELPSSYAHHGGFWIPGMRFDLPQPLGPEAIDIEHFQITTLVLRRLFAQVQSSTFNEVVALYRAKWIPRDSFVIWPARKGPLVWHQLEPTRDPMVDPKLSDSFFESLKARYGWPEQGRRSS